MARSCISDLAGSLTQRSLQNRHILAGRGRGGGLRQVFATGLHWFLASPPPRPFWTPYALKLSTLSLSLSLSAPGLRVPAFGFVGDWGIVAICLRHRFRGGSCRVFVQRSMFKDVRLYMLPINSAPKPCPESHSPRRLTEAQQQCLALEPCTPQLNPTNPNP